MHIPIPMGGQVAFPRRAVWCVGRGCCLLKAEATMFPRRSSYKTRSEALRPPSWCYLAPPNTEESQPSAEADDPPRGSVPVTCTENRRACFILTTTRAWNLPSSTTLACVTYMAQQNTRHSK